MDKKYENMSLYYDGELTGDELEAFETKLFENPEFAQEYTNYAQFLETVVSTPLVEPPQGLRESIMKRIHEESRPIELIGEKTTNKPKRKNFPSLFPTTTIQSLLLNENIKPRSFRRFASAAAAVVACVVVLGTAISMLESGQQVQFATLPLPAGAPAAPAPAAGNMDSLWSEVEAQSEEFLSLTDGIELPMAARAGIVTAEASGLPFGTSLATQQDLFTEDLVIRSANISVEVEDFDIAMRTINSLSGHSEDVHLWGGGARNPISSATITRRVPIERYNESLAVLRDMGRVTHESEHTNNVSSSIANAQARSSALNHEIARLFTYLEHSETIGDLNLISTRIGRVEQETIDAQRQIHQLTHSVSQPTIQISIMEVDTVEIQPTSFFDDVSTGFIGSLHFISNTFTGLIVMVARFALPTLIVAVLAFIFIRVYRGFTKPAPKEDSSDEA